MTYNVRPGQLFSDLNLRQAMQLCLDKIPTVAAASDGIGVPVYADVPPGIWAYDDEIPKPAHDVAAAKGLIESSGWTLGADGVYVRQGRRLEATIWLRPELSVRVKFAAILSNQARACGMDLHATQEDFGTLLDGLSAWPNLEPDSTSPFDLYLVGFNGGWDPLTDKFASEAITTEASPYGDNIGGFSDARIDDLLSRMESTYDLDARAQLFRQYQQILAEQQPALFAFNFVRDVAVSSGLRTTTGAINLDDPQWMAFPERLVLATGGSQ
jgi:peptide/nickel transport system substrate-binding protein